MSYLPFWLGGLGLALLPLVHLLLLKRSLAVSGRTSALIDRLRFGKVEPAQPMSELDMIAALRALTVAEFGEAAIDPEQSAPAVASPSQEVVPTSTAGEHLLFFAGVTLGGALSWLLGPASAPVLGLRSELFARLFGGSPWISALVLLSGGVLVGAGTRMAGGCTSGHGLCGVSRGQPGSLVATASFFGTAVVVSFLLGALL